jgi:hypothetical protein
VTKPPNPLTAHATGDKAEADAGAKDAKLQKFEKFTEVIQKGSLVGVIIGDRSVKDDYFIWLAFTLVIGVLVLVKLI